MNIDKIDLQERHAEFWELLWSVIAVISLALLFVLLYLRIGR